MFKLAAAVLATVSAANVKEIMEIQKSAQELFTIKVNRGKFLEFAEATVDFTNSTTTWINGEHDAAF